MTNNDIKRKKVDLLSFQQTLNEQFLDIFKSKKEGDQETQVTDNLGLHAVTDDFLFFLPLKDLKNISMDNNYEDMMYTKSWILGFNQVRGEVYTIIDFKRTIELLAKGICPTTKAKLNKESRIIYLKNTEESKLGVLLESVKLDYTAEFTPIFHHHDIENQSSWSISEEVDFHAFIKKEKMSEKEWLIMNKLYEAATFSTKLNNHDVKDRAELLNDPHHKWEDTMLYLIKDVYLDAFGNRPVIVFNFDNLTKLLINVSPF